MSDRVVVRYTVPDPRQQPVYAHVFPDRKTECRDLPEAQRLVRDLTKAGFRNARVDE